jgi:hypothetical protein
MIGWPSSTRTRPIREGGDEGTPQSTVWVWIWRIFGPMTWLWELSFVAWALLASYLIFAKGHLDWTHHALGRDFINYWTAGHLTLSGQVNDIFQPKLFLAHERQLFDPRLPFHFWSYPPPALFLVAPLGLTGYFTGFALWSLGGVAALYLALRLWPEPGWVRWMILLCPAVPTDIALGQNGAYTAALLIGGLMLMERKPRALSGPVDSAGPDKKGSNSEIWAGVQFGLLIFKPQIGVLLPVTVLARRHWKVLAAAAITGVVVLLASLVVFGPGAWRGFFGPTLTTQGLMLRQGRGPFRWMMPSAYMAARVLKFSWPDSAMIQAPFTLLAIIATWRVSVRRDVSAAWKAAVVMTATFVATPQAFNYDLIPVAAAALLLLRHDRRLWLSLPIVILTWTLPVTMLALQEIKAPIAPLVLTALLLRLWALADYRPKRRLKRSIASQAVSNT